MGREPAVSVVPLSSGPAVDIVVGEGSANGPIWPGMGAVHRSVIFLSLAGGAGTRALSHPSDSVYYVLEGAGAVQDGDGTAQQLTEGAMIHVDAATTYRFTAGAEGLKLLGGPCPPDPAWYPPPSAGAVSWR